MWHRLLATLTVLLLDPVRTDSGISTTGFSNELRTGFARLFHNGIEQPQQNPFIILNPELSSNLIGQPRPAPNVPASPAGYFGPAPRPRFHSPRPRRPNDVLVIVMKSSPANCTATNGTSTENDPEGGGDDDDEEAGNPDDDAEEVEVIAGGANNGKEPSRCVWAILSCCVPANMPVKFTCFDVLGCSSAFWDTNPCVPAIIKVAMDEATKYYGPITSTNRTTAASPSPPADAPAASDNMPVDLTSPEGTASVTTSTTPAAA
ncbi:uncharacterized protein LOC126835911 isoform X2 [Adelges cooleyi]|uniref:uncharacterized protein LOC126835911 isoform X2 n=1 Tax=Adelges cooleyi TaxID=133065 RepID=UPI00217F504A|nr:uncharacterized protein LOC126835911 isoform X2 [Adelges cooleyi]